MPKYVIERNVTGIGNSSAENLKQMAIKSNEVLKKMGPEIQWEESFVTDDKIYCIYIAKDEKQIYEHAKLSGFPVDRVSEIKTIIDPTTAETKIEWTEDLEKLKSNYQESFT